MSLILMMHVVLADVDDVDVCWCTVCVLLN